MILEWTFPTRQQTALSTGTLGQPTGKKDEKTGRLPTGAGRGSATKNAT